jgi:hypothetical protein
LAAGSAIAGLDVAGAIDVVSAAADTDVSEADVEVSLEHAETPRTAIAAMVAAVNVLR